MKWFLTLLIGMLPAMAAAQDKVVIVIVGDSTVKTYDPAKSPQRGWGQAIVPLLDASKVEVRNYAEGGRSSKSFIAEGKWKKAIESMPKPTYVLIQFGHNDIPNKGPERETLPGEVPAELPKEGLGSAASDWYRNNIRVYVEQSKAVAAIPILVTPMERRSFDSKGKVRPKNKPWSDGMISVAKELDVPLIDLNAYSVETYNALGLDKAAKLHCQKADGSGIDDTHYNDTGASVWAEYIAGQLRVKFPDLGPLITPPPFNTAKSLAR